MRISHMNQSSFVDGPGQRTVLFMQGCHFHCPGCQNEKLWDPNGGGEVDLVVIASVLDALSKTHRNITISGGEPFNQPIELYSLVALLRSFGIKNILIYTGYTWEKLNDDLNPDWLIRLDILDLVDTIVDGQFVKSKDDDFISWRGSRNQRPINVPETRNSGKLVVHDWDNALTVGPDGSIFTPLGFSEMFEDTWVSSDTRRCGQTD